MRNKMFKIVSILMVAVFVLAAVPAPAVSAAPVAADKVTVTWWHISTKDPGLSDWQKMADDYMKANPNVKIEITVLENEAFKTKLATVMQSGEVPDIFQSWGGGGLAEQIDAGLLKDITADLDADGGKWRKSYRSGCSGYLRERRQELRRAVGYGYGRLVVQQRPLQKSWY